MAKASVSGTSLSQRIDKPMSKCCTRGTLHHFSQQSSHWDTCVVMIGKADIARVIRNGIARVSETPPTYEVGGSHGEYCRVRTTGTRGKYVGKYEGGFESEARSHRAGVRDGRFEEATVLENPLVPSSTRSRQLYQRQHCPPEQLAKKTRRRACNLPDRDEGSSVADVHTKTDSTREKTVASNRSHQQQLQDAWPLVSSKRLRHSVATHVVRGASDDRYVAVTDDVCQGRQIDLVGPRQVSQRS